MTKKTMFGPAKHKYLAKIVSLETPVKAALSVKKLQTQFGSAKTASKRLRIARATQLAASRASATTKRQSLSPRERVQYAKVAKIYKDAAKSFFSKLK